MSSNPDRDQTDPANDRPEARVAREVRRPIDAPSLPPWVPRTPPAPEGDEDAPTQSVLFEDLGISGPPAEVMEPEPAEDPRDLARRLAEQAKQRLANQQPQEEPSMSGEDPRELARRLAEEAKRRLREVPPPVDEPLDELFDHNAAPTSSPPVSEPDDDDSPYVANPSDDDGESAPSEMHAIPLSARPTSASSRPMTALEALAAAREAEKNRPSPPVERSPAPAREAPAAAVRRTPERAERAANPAPMAQVEAIVQEHFPGATADPAQPVTNVDVFRALWRAHRTRAQHEGDVSLVATAGVLLDAVERVAPGWLVAARVSIGSRQHPPEPWAVWIDLERRTVIGVARPAEVYLAGL